MLAFTNMLICFNQLIASALSFSNDVFEFEKDFEKIGHCVIVRVIMKICFFYKKYEITYKNVK